MSGTLIRPLAQVLWSSRRLSISWSVLTGVIEVTGFMWGGGGDPSGVSGLFSVGLGRQPLLKSDKVLPSSEDEREKQALVQTSLSSRLFAVSVYLPSC